MQKKKNNYHIYFFIIAIILIFAASAKYFLVDNQRQTKGEFIDICTQSGGSPGYAEVIIKGQDPSSPGILHCNCPYPCGYVNYGNPFKGCDVYCKNRNAINAINNISGCKQDSDCILVHPIDGSISSCCWGCSRFSINQKHEEEYYALFSQECNEIECPPYGPGAACPPIKAACINLKCTALYEAIQKSQTTSEIQKSPEFSSLLQVERLPFGNINGISLVDLNNDGIQEFVVANFDGPTTSTTIKAYGYEADLWWSSSPLPNLVASPGSFAVADIDSDNYNEIVVSLGPWFQTYPYIYVFEHDGYVKQNWPVTVQSGPYIGFTSPMLINLDGSTSLDKKLEIVVSKQMANGIRTMAFREDSTPLWQRDIQISGAARVDAGAVGVLDPSNNYDLIEVVAGVYRYGVPWESRIVTTTQKGLPFRTIAQLAAEMRGYAVLGDIDNNKDIETVFGTVRGNIIGVHTYNHDGTIFPGWPKLISPKGPPILSDIDGDKDLEIIVISNDNRLHVFHHNGRVVFGWPRSTNGINWVSDPVISNIDDDQDVEIILGIQTENGCGLIAFNKDGSTADGFPISLFKLPPDNYCRVVYLEIAKEENSEMAKIVAVTDGYALVSDYNAAFQIYTNSIYDPKLMLWPKYFHDKVNSNNYNFDFV